jgi:hypothetical protein
LNRLSSCHEIAFAPLVLFALAACSSDHAPASPRADGGPLDTSDASKAPPGLTLAWRIVETGAIGSAMDAGAGVQSTRDLPGIPGVKVCVYQHDEIPCVTSEADGKLVLRGLPKTTDLILTTEKDGYVKTLRAIETASTPMDGIAEPMVTSKTSTARPSVGVPVDDTKGAISFFALSLESDGGLVLPEGVKVTLSPGTADGPFFTRPNNTFDKVATATVGGVGLFLNVDPGNYELTFDYPSANCRPVSSPFGAFGFPSPPTSVKFPVLSGYVTDQMGVLCTPKSVLVEDAPVTDASSSGDH